MISKFRPTINGFILIIAFAPELKASELKVYDATLMQKYIISEGSKVAPIKQGIEYDMDIIPMDVPTKEEIPHQSQQIKQTPSQNEPSNPRKEITKIDNKPEVKPEIKPEAKPEPKPEVAVKVPEIKITEPVKTPEPPKEAPELLNATAKKPYCVLGQDQLNKSPLAAKLNGFTPYNRISKGRSSEKYMGYTYIDLKIEFKKDGSYTATGCGSKPFIGYTCQVADKGTLRTCYYNGKIYLHSYSITNDVTTPREYIAGKKSFTISDDTYGVFNMTSNEVGQ